MCNNRYFWRQIFILSTCVFYTTSLGFMVAFPSVMNPALLSPNTTDIHATSDQTSWLAASNGIAGMVGFFILSPLLQTSGRKIVTITCNLLVLIGWIIFPLANNITTLFAARIIQGLAIGGTYINGMIVCEYVDPKRRGYFMTIKKLSGTIGTLICHAMSLFWNWRQIAAFAIILPTVALITTLFWPESPSYLAMKGRFEDCKKSFVWLNGSSNNGNELKQLMSTQMERLEKPNKEKSYKLLLKKDFLKPLAVVSLLTLVLDSCGRYFFMVYGIQIMIELIGDKSISIYCSLGADCLIIIAMISSCFVIRCFKRRTILFSFGIVTVSIMFLIGLIMLLKSYNIGANLGWLAPSIVVLQNFVVNIGIIPVAFTLIGEIFPLEYKGTGSCLSGVVWTIFYTFTLKLTPFLIDTTGVGGTYAVYGIIISICLLLLYFIVPETKDKTLQQIEDEIKGVKRTTSEFEANTLLS